MPLLVILPMRSEHTLSINCFFLGGDSSEDFAVEILKTQNVSILKDLIKEKQSPHLNHVIASELILSQVSLPMDSIMPELTVESVEGQKLQQSAKARAGKAANTKASCPVLPKCCYVFLMQFTYVRDY